MADIRIENVTKRFDNFVAVDNVTLTAEDQEFVVLLGPSGCGKTTLLRAMARVVGLASSRGRSRWRLSFLQIRCVAIADPQWDQ